MILLDTVVLSELRKREASAEVVRWLTGFRDSDLFLSVVSICEIERGIEKKRKSDPVFVESLTQWIEDLLRLYGDRVLPVTPAVSRHWGILSARLGNDSTDLLIAATALTHGLQVATRNIQHFASTGVGVINPFDDGRIIIEPIRTAEHDVDQLLSGITPENLHTEVDFGAPVGKEAE